MADRDRPSDTELTELETIAGAGAPLALEAEQGRDGRLTVRASDDALKAHRALPELITAIRRLRREVEELREDNTQLKQRGQERARGPEARRPEPSPDREQAADELGSLLSAPFAVPPRAAAAAKSDPLVALAVQVAKALGEDAKDIERARLIAMALAATQGDLDRFWEARRQRAAKPKAPAARKK